MIEINIDRGFPCEERRENGIDNMPSDLKKAHEALDRAMDVVFSAKPFNNELARQKALLEMYKKMTKTA